jgi:hypothetical protein
MNANTPAPAPDADRSAGWGRYLLWLAVALILYVLCPPVALKCSYFNSTQHGFDAYAALYFPVRCLDAHVPFVHDFYQCYFDLWREP